MLAAYDRVGNPSSLHSFGQRARAHVEDARDTIAAALGADAYDVVFTSGGTEADNTAVKGVYAARQADRSRPRILVSAVEHHAVFEAAEAVAADTDAELVTIDVDDNGRVRPERLRELVESDPESVAVISVMWANNETGVVQPVPELAAIAAEHAIPFHTDAVQAVGHVAVSFAGSGVDALTLTAHKLGGPVGVGALIVRRGLTITPLLHGGGQERDIRSGTVDVAGIAGFAAAVDEAVRTLPSEAVRQRRLRDDLADALAPLGVCPTAAAAERLPSIAHFVFGDCEADSLLFALDQRGVACSTGSACTAGVSQPSHVLVAMGKDPDVAPLRFSFGHDSTTADVAAVAAAIGPAYQAARAAGRQNRQHLATESAGVA